METLRPRLHWGHFLQALFFGRPLLSNVIRKNLQTSKARQCLGQQWQCMQSPKLGPSPLRSFSTSPRTTRAKSSVTSGWMSTKYLPVAPRKPRRFAVHGSHWIDEYAWMQDGLSEEILQYLEVENLYFQHYFKSSVSDAENRWKRKTQLYKQIESNSESWQEIKDVGDHVYYPSISSTGSNTFCRKSKETGEVQVLLDTEELKERFNYQQVVVTAFKFSPKGRYLGAVVEVSPNRCDGHIIRMDSIGGQPSIVDSIPNIFNLEFCGDDCALYTRTLKGQPRQMWSHLIGSNLPDIDLCLFEEEDDRFSVDLTHTKDRRYVIVNSNSRTTSEVWFCRSQQWPNTLLEILWPRQDNVECYVDHCSNTFFALTTGGESCELKLLAANNGSNFKRASVWKELYNPPPGLVIQDMDVFSSKCVLSVLENNVPGFVVVPHLQPESPTHIKVPSEYSTLIPSLNAEPAAMEYHFHLSSPIHPPRPFLLDLQTCQVSPSVGHGDEYGEGKDQVHDLGPGTRPEEFVCQRLLAPSKDGTEVPMTVFHKKSLALDGKSPMLVVGYGAYGMNLDLGFRGERMALLSDGWVLAFCHVRGGGELGRHWYHSGRLENKNHSFEDFESCIELLHSLGYSSPALTAGWGVSAGGLLLGVLCNRRPDLIRTAVMRMPFVDVRSSMLDHSSPLTSQDHEEWGNPSTSHSAFQDISAYCPYNNLEAQKYPSILVTTSLGDVEVPYWGPAKYVARLREKTRYHTDCVILLKVLKEGGHFQLDDSDASLKQWSQELAFLQYELRLMDLY